MTKLEILEHQKKFNHMKKLDEELWEKVDDLVLFFLPDHQSEESEEIKKIYDLESKVLKEIEKLEKTEKANPKIYDAHTAAGDEERLKWITVDTKHRNLKGVIHEWLDGKIQK